jgi:hypothetical protein
MSLKVTSPKAQGIFMPTPAQLATAYGSITDAAEKAGKLKPLKGAPVGASKATPVNINKPGMLGVNREVYDIRGQLYLKTQVVAPDAQAKWFKVGPAPMF